MRLTVSTWNINSVRLRIDLVAKFVKATRPDLLCLQETKCPDDRFPLKRFRRLGYAHAAINGQKGYHGVAVLSRLPFDPRLAESCDRGTLFVHDYADAPLAKQLGELAARLDEHAASRPHKAQV